MWEVVFHKKAVKQLGKLPKLEQTKLQFLVKDLMVNGPTLPAWPNYSKLGPNLYHCHLSYKWVACWEKKGNELKLIEIYYVGSREDAPY